MAATTRGNRQASPADADLGELAERLADLERIQTITLRILARAAVRAAPGQGSATFARILVVELRLATHEEVAAVEAWLTAHPGG